MTLEDDLKQWATDMGKPLDDLKREAEEIRKTKTADVKPEHLDKYVSNVLRARMARQFVALQRASRMQVIVVTKSGSRVASTKDGQRRDVADAFAYVKPKDGGQPHWAMLTFWAESTKTLVGLDIGRVYDADLTPGSGGGNNGSLRSYVWPEGVGFASKSEKVVDVQNLVGGIPAPAYKEMESRIDDGNVYAMRGVVSRINTGQTEQGRPYAVMNLIPHDMPMSESVQSGGIPCWVDKSSISYGQDSEVIVIGQFSRSKRDERMNMLGKAVVPLIVVQQGQAEKQLPESLKKEEVMKDVKKDVDEFFS